MTKAVTGTKSLKNFTKRGGVPAESSAVKNRRTA
jgi:hypothetical protein